MSNPNGRSSTQKKALKKRLSRGKQVVQCCFCKQKMNIKSATIEHIMPLFYGGGWNIENLALSCEQCNHERGILSFEEFKSWKRGNLSRPPRDYNKFLV
ncbi:MAG TPA: HNH endonuclease [Candidatus Glassbacteria bacterium]|nr:HNH endonuclease [Candidatus Glassbacteria bacterium]